MMWRGTEDGYRSQNEAVSKYRYVTARDVISYGEREMEISGRELKGASGRRFCEGRVGLRLTA
jgi:hypothetical protein